VLPGRSAGREDLPHDPGDFRRITLKNPRDHEAAGAGAAIGALALCAFVIGSTEFVVPGILPQIARGLHVSITAAGLLVSGYALGVVVGAPLVTIAVIRFRRKPVLLGLLGFCVAGNALSGLAGSYAVLMSGRVLASLCHGAFFGVASVVAADLVSPGRRARAVAGMFMGITLANLIGVPAGAYLGQHLGWRTAFLAIAGTGALSFLGVAWFVPPTGEGQARRLRSEARAFASPQMWLALAMTAFGFGAVYCPLTYVVPLMTSVAGFPPSAVSPLLVLFGTGLTLGNIAGARAADQNLMAALRIVLLCLTAVLAIFTWTSHTRVGAVVTLFLVGFFAYATVPGFTTRVINVAGSDGAVLASSAAVAAFNLGNAAGAYLGGVALTLAHTPAGTALMGAAMAAIGLAAAIISAHGPIGPGWNPRPTVAQPRARTADGRCPP
jgi:MFS transporter, DHA1 family, inner membrane transport protein